MNEHIIHYCFILSEEQMKFLRSKKYKIDRMECFMSLVELAERETKLVQISKTQQIEILRGQVMVDNTQLSKLWDQDRKTVPKLIDAMEALGISYESLLILSSCSCNALRILVLPSVLIFSTLSYSKLPKWFMGMSTMTSGL